MEILNNAQGYPTTPSWVCFEPDGKINIGLNAQDRDSLNTGTVVFDAKRMIGKNFDDEDVQ